MATKCVEPAWTPRRAREALLEAGFVSDRSRAVYVRVGRPVSRYVEPEARPVLEARGVDPEDPIIPLEGRIAFRAVVRCPALVGEIALGVLAERIRSRAGTRSAA